MARRKKTDDQPDDSNDQHADAASDDTFGLPEIEYEPINREPADDPEPEPEPTPTPTPAAETHHSQYTEKEPVTNRSMERDDIRQTEYSSTYYDEDEGGSPWPKILGITF